MPTDREAVFDKEVRRHVYNYIINKSVVPTIIETAAALSSAQSEIRASFKRLADAHMLVLQRDTSEILMANPFSAVPTPFLVQVGVHSFYGNCVWDAMGIPAMLKQDAAIRTSCGDCGTAMNLKITNGSVEQSEGIVHFAIPAAHWWDDIVFS